MKTSYIKGLVIFILLLALVDCQKNTKPIVVGEEVEVTTETIGIEGGTITVSKPGDPLDGFKIEVPAGAYQEEKTFKISYRSIVRHQIGNKFNPITPMIYVENGGDIAEDMMTVTIPAYISEGCFAMAFYYDETTGKLNGLPLIDKTATSLTIRTTHFTPIVGTEINEDDLLEDPVDSGFKHGVDDWQFVNEGSVVEPRGHCSGQCMAAMYYYDYIRVPDLGTKDEKPSLYGLYDNDGNPDFKTPDFQWDDELAYKLCSMIHKKQKWEKSMTVHLRQVQDKKDDKWTLGCFAYSLAVEENSPQHMSIGRTLNKGTTQQRWEGHVLIIYKKSERIKLTDGREVYILYASDPNEPKQNGVEHEQEIIYDISAGKFDPYYFGDDDQGNRIELDDVIYYDKYCLMEKESVEKLWSQVEDKSIGKGDFPEYSLTVVEADTEKSLYDGFKTSSGSITIKLCDISTDPFLFQQRLVLYKATISNKIGTVQEIGTYDLANDDDDCLRVTINNIQEGDNLFGFLIKDKYKNPFTNKIHWNFVGFDWLHIIREKDQTGGDLSQLTRCNIEVFDVVSSCQDTDGNTFEDITEPACHAEEGSFSGNTFNATYDIKSYGGYGARKGTMTVVLDIDPTSNEIVGVKSFSCEETSYINEEAYIISHISGENVPLLWDWSPRQKEFEGQGENVCESITALEQILRSYDADNKKWWEETCTGDKCISDDTPLIKINFHDKE